MLKEVIPGSYLCKLNNGVAYYLVAKGIYDMIHQGYESTALSNTAEHTRLYWAKINLDHLLGGTRYPTEYHKIKLVNWGDLPKNYQLDAIALNEEIRKVYGKDYAHTFKSVMDSNKLRDLVFRVVDTSTSILRDYKWEGATDVNNKVHVLKEVASKPFFYPEQVQLKDSTSEEWSKSYGEKPCETIPKQHAENNQSSVVKTNTMDQTLFNNMPGMNLAFGKIQKGLIALSFNGELAFKDKSGNYVTINKEGEQKIRTDVGSMKLDIDFYQMPTQDLIKGDVILLDGEFLIVGENVKGDTKFINPLTGATTNKLERTNVINMYFYTKVVSMFDMLEGKGKGGTLGGIDPMMLALMSQGGNAGGQDMTQFLLMSQLAGKGGDSSSMLPLLMMSGGLGGASNGENGGIGQLLMMQALSGNKTGGLFGKKTPVKAAPKRAPAKKAAKRAPVKG